MVHKALDEIGEYDPHLLYVDPTHLAFLSRVMKRNGRAAHKKEGFCINSSFTLCTQVARRQIREFFGSSIPFADTVAMSEFGYIGFECASGALHLNNEDFYLEFLWNGRPVDSGQLGELVITSIGDPLSPHIRYKTGDLYRPMDATCVCGSLLPVVRFDGRIRNILYRKDQSIVTPRQLDDVVGSAPWLDVYRIEQSENSEFSFRFIGNEEACPQFEEELRARLKDALRVPDITFSNVKYCPAERGGKFLSCISAIATKRAAQCANTGAGVA